MYVLFDKFLTLKTKQIEDMGALGISMLVSNIKMNGGGWKGEVDSADNDGEKLEELFMKKCNNSDFSRVLECFNFQSFSTEEIFKQVSVNKTNLRNILSLVFKNFYLNFSENYII